MTIFSENKQLKTMVENMPLFFTGMYVFLSIPDIVKLQIKLDPCPGISAQSTADMCTTDYATEDDNDGGTTIDSVALRVTTQQGGCTCEVTLLNQQDIYTLNMRKYDDKTNAAPENAACGLAIDLDYNIPNNLPENKNPVECVEGTQTRSISLAKNGILHLRSRVISGSFTRGYCMQIYRTNTGNQPRIQINCSHPSMQKTQNTTDAFIQDTNLSDIDTTLYIAIGLGSAVVVIALFVVVAIIIIRRKSNKNTDSTEVNPEVDCNNDDSDGLKYNCLYNTSEQQEIMEGDYHTVEVEGKPYSTEKQNFGSDYGAVDGNYSSVDIVNMPAKDCSKTDNKIKSSSTTTPRPEIQRTEEDTSTNLKHVTPMSDSYVEYAVVDKSGITDKKVKHISAPNDSNVEYAVIDKK